MHYPISAAEIDGAIRNRWRRNNLTTHLIRPYDFTIADGAIRVRIVSCRCRVPGVQQIAAKLGPLGLEWNAILERFPIRVVAYRLRVEFTSEESHRG